MINGKKVLGVTLARGGSKSVPKKNIRPLAGKPVIAYTIEAAKRSAYLDDYIVSTDDQEIADVSASFGARIPFLRPVNLATDTATSGDALVHAVAYVEQETGEKFDYVVEMMATNPLKTTAQIDQAIEMLDAKKADSVIAVTRVYDQHPARIKKLDDEGRLEDFCIPEPLEARRQDLTPPAYIRCGSIYTIRRDYLMETKARYGSQESYALVIPDDESINVDTELDFAVAEILMQRQKQ
ncbi:cytidylyltransferase domain-containing protein [Desulfovibrio ferrophilus]|uniref:Cytidylyltransferase domain protein n=1 Tax=Desulfovibrio ferrophilus TaxID=241368 RepID=A0A2Z6B2B9_9BACT|nr:acylneuraminate cytidylyltransferase family protein [Desulfovibrio ferrophilus]BBD09580.1 cytidylyltransferase domain protein [Desulfovibrio ferrophilus]